MVKNVMAWQEIHIVTSAQFAECIGDTLLSLGADALTLKDAGDQPIYEPALDATPVWQETIVIGLFDEHHDMTPVLNYVYAEQALSKLTSFHVQPLANQDWERRCLDDLVPLCFGQRLWVCPSSQIPPDSEAINVILDPGLAFGTGTHPTTSLCLSWLDAHLQPGASVIDYGCGSGILAIAALKLGAAHVLAIDHDPQALTATADNRTRNHIHPDLLTTSLPNQLKTVAVDLVMANILAKPLIELAFFLGTLVKVDGHILLSGILIDQSEAVIQAYAPWFNMQPPVSEGDWIRLVGIRRAN